jgi:hypothetical protein
MLDTTLIATQIAALEAEVADLKRRVPAVRRVVPVPPIEQGTVVAYPHDTVFAMPPAADLLALHRVVLARFVQLRLDPSWRSEQEARQEFAAAFRALGSMRRADALDQKHATTFWIDRAEDVLRAAGAPDMFTLQSFTAALIAHGDVLYSDLGTFPYVAFGLGLGGRAAGGAWRKVLAGKMLDPVKVDQRHAPGSPARAVGVGA